MFKLFTVFDRESKTFDRPFAAPTERDARAGFAHAVNNKETNFGQFPNDFDLYLLGEFDPREGELKPSKPELLVTGQSLVKEQSNE